MQDKIKELEYKIRILEEENSQLAKRAEDSMLLRLISERIEDIESQAELLTSTLEQISILKDIPYCTCAAIEAGHLKPLATYAAFSNEEHIGYPISLSKESLNQLMNEPLLALQPGDFTTQFPIGSFTPTCTVFIPFSTQDIKHGVFILMDDATDADHLSIIIPLLNHVIRMAIAKYDNMHLLTALKEANDELEKRVSQRTAELSRANYAMEREYAKTLRSESALKESQEILMTVLDSIDAAVYVIDMQTYEILYSNKGGTDRSGNELIGKTCYIALRGKDDPCDFCTNDQLLNPDGTPAGTVIWEEENPVTHKWYLNHDHAIKWIDGRTVRLQIATDITKTKLIESQMLHSRKLEAVGRLAGGVAHDFNNLLMGIQGRTVLLEEEIPAPTADIQDHIKAIEKYVGSASQLTNQLLGFARGGKYEVEPLPLNDLINETVSLFGRTHKAIKMHCSLLLDSPVIEGDRNQIEQVLLNIYINAWHAMPDGGDLYLSTSMKEIPEPVTSDLQLTPGRYVKIAIRDTGTGMERSVLDKIFEPFFTTRKKGTGTGMGLASAYGIIKNHAGLIRAHSTPGRGSTFEIYLPTSDIPVPEQQPLAPNEPVKGEETILMIDDEEIIITVGKVILQRLGYHVETALNWLKAIDILKENPAIDLVIMDMIMPGMEGIELYKNIQTIRPNLPVILSSGYACNGKAQEIMKQGCNGFIQKPYSKDELSRKIIEVLGK